MIDYEEFLKTPEDVLEFRHPRGVFKKDNPARAVLNKTLETEYRAVYRIASNEAWTEGNINWCGETFFILTRKGKILEHTNSEWGGIGIAKVWK